MTRRITILMAVAWFATTSLLAGTISVAWDPVDDTDLVTYQVFWGRSPGDYSARWDLGLDTSATIRGLADCTTYYVAVKAKDAEGNVSPSYSNVISGYPRPLVTAVTPAEATQGERLAVVVTGTNFAPGAAVSFGHPDVIVQSVTVESCTRLIAIVAVGNAAAGGPISVGVTNPDRSFGSSESLFAVRVAEPPTVIAAFPEGDATGVPVSARPTVTWSVPVDPASLDAFTVSLLDASGAPVPQAAGSPALSPDGRTAIVVPASDLAYRASYAVRVLGGESGIRDSAGRTMTATYLGGGFTTERDSTAPLVSAVRATAAATTAEIGWTTDEPADGRVRYRKAVDSIFRQGASDDVVVTEHSIALRGLTPSTTYVFQVSSADAEGNRSDDSAEGTFTTAASSYAYIALEPETGELTSPVEAIPGPDAFRGAWLETSTDAPVASSTEPSGVARTSFHLPTDGTWRVWMRLFAPPEAPGAWWESVDGAPRRAIAPPTTGEWRWTAGPVYPLGRGLHDLELVGGDAGARVDRVLITDDPGFDPTEEPGDDRSAPAAPTELTATTAADSTTLGWTNPESDVAGNVVRYRTDGRFPAGPEDGFPAWSGEATGSSVVSIVHTPVPPDETYSYGVFALDRSGNASGAATILVVPAPAPVTRTPLFSTSQNQFFAGIGTLRHEAIYASDPAGLRLAVDPFLPAGLGLDGFQFQDATRVVFSTSASGGLTHSGGFTPLKKNNLYRYDLATRAVSLFYDFEARGISGLDAFAVLRDGRIAFSSEATAVVPVGNGATLTLRTKNAYALEPATGAITLLLDGDLLGIRDFDLLGEGEPGEIVFSTSADQVIRTGLNLRHQNAYAWHRASGVVRLAFDGRALGLSTLDALDLDAPLEAAAAAGPRPAE